MPTLATTRAVAAQLILATSENANQTTVESVVNDLDRYNITTQWIRYPIARSFYSDPGAPVASVTLDVVIPVYNDTTNIRFTAIGYNKPVTTANRRLRVQRYTLATGVTADTLHDVTLLTTDIRGCLDGTVAALVPGTYGFRLLYEATAGNLDAEEWANFDLWVAVQLAEATEL